MHGFDVAALLGIVLAIWLGFRMAVRVPRTAPSIAVLLFILLIATLSPGQPWISVYSFGRTLTPLLLIVAMEGLRRRSWPALLPTALVSACALLQMAPQAIRIARGLF